MDKRRFAFDKSNYILLIAGVAVIIAGFVLMLGPGSTMTHFEPDIFSFRRVKLAPAICFLGFVFMIVSIMVKPKEKNSDNNK